MIEAASNFNLQNLTGSLGSLSTLIPLIVSIGGIYYLGKKTRQWGTVIMAVLLGLILAGTTIGSAITGEMSTLTGGLIN